MHSLQLVDFKNSLAIQVIDNGQDERGAMV